MYDPTLGSRVLSSIGNNFEPCIRWREIHGCRAAFRTLGVGFDGQVVLLVLGRGIMYLALRIYFSTIRSLNPRQVGSCT